MRTHRHLAILGLILSLVGGTLARSAEEWPAFRGPSGDGHADPQASPPLRWSETENIRWKTAIPGKAWSSPVVSGSDVWIATASPDGKELGVMCLDRERGTIRLERVVFRVSKPAFCHPFNSYASPTPVIAKDRVFVHYGSAGTACLDAVRGETLWERRDLPCDHFRGAGSSPIVHGDCLYLPFDGFDLQYVVALDPRTGKTVWKQDRGTVYPSDDGDFRKAYATPAVIPMEEGELVCPAAHATTAHDPRTGRELWRIVHGGMNAPLRPLFSHGLVLLTTGPGGQQLVAVRPGGRGDVTATHRAWSYARGVPTRSSPIVAGDRLYFVHDAGVLTVLEMPSGREIRKHRLGGEYSASPVLAGGKLYFFDQNGAAHVVEPGDECRVLGTNRLDDGCMASPAVVGNALYVRTKTHLYRIENSSSKTPQARP